MVFSPKTVHLSSTNTQQSPLGEPGSPALLPLLYWHSLREADTSFIIPKNFRCHYFPRVGEGRMAGYKDCSFTRATRLLSHLLQPSSTPDTAPLMAQATTTSNRQNTISSPELQKAAEELAVKLEARWSSKDLSLAEFLLLESRRGRG